MITKINCTTLNPVLKNYEYYAPLFSEGVMPTDAVCEWGARVCYNSEDKFGSNPSFVKKIVEMEHYDVLEHGVISFDIITAYENVGELLACFYLFSSDYPFFKIKYSHTLSENVNGDELFNVHISGSLRVWREIINRHPISGITYLVDNRDEAQILYALYKLSPNAMFDIPTKVVEQDYLLTLGEKIHIDHEILEALKRGYNYELTDLSTGGEFVVLGRCSHPNDNGELAHITFQTKSVSRAFLAQHTRHRLLSFSAFSQRYVDLEKNNPEKLFVYNYETEEQAKILNRFQKYAKRSYRELRNSGMKKEDARQILPNMTATNIVTSGYGAGIEHYIKLRTDKAAQFEIREVANHLEEAYWN